MTRMAQALEGPVHLKAWPQLDPACLVPHAAAAASQAHPCHVATAMRRALGRQWQGEQGKGKGRKTLSLLSSLSPPLFPLFPVRSRFVPAWPSHAKRADSQALARVSV